MAQAQGSPVEGTKGASKLAADRPGSTGRSLPSPGRMGTGLALALVAGLGLRASAQDKGPAPQGLSYATPQQCVWVYRVQVDERFSLPAYADHYNRREEHSLSWLAMGRDADDQVRALLLSDDAGVRSQTTDDPTPQRIWRRLDLPERLSPNFGPAAPDAACRDRSWDSLEDALALAFVEFPAGGIPSSGDWLGARVSGDGSTCSAANACCNLGACLNADQEHDPDASCVLPSWSESLDASAEPGAPMRVISTWSDGRPGDQGASAGREMSFDGELKRMLSSQIILSHPFLGVERDILVEAIDGCEGLKAPREDPEGLRRARTEFSKALSPAPERGMP